ncbi:hypothetical protein [Marinimicrobium locisalis]|uniref:hypothetical protein n=1 Tax=Marinimicrobium locisalis TaxID=546022 RepID=UPI003221D999
MRLLTWLLLSGFALPALADSSTYPIHYHITLNPEKERAEVVIESDHGGQLKQLDFNLTYGDYSNFEANGSFEIEDDRAIWHPPAEDARLRFHATVTHERDPGEYDAMITEDWAIFRGDNIIPPAWARTDKGARAKAYLTFTLPEEWTSVTTGWKKLDDRRFRIDNSERRFDRPTGWMIAGKLGTRREQLGDTHLVVSAPKGSSLRRMDVITLITNVWPEVEKAFGTTPPKFAVIGHGEPMWRGALSGPNALFLHGDRPMVSENGTSTVIHELMHVVTRIRSKDKSDWLAEGLAEYYAVELMYRAGALTQQRRERTLNSLRKWADNDEVTNLRTGDSSGAITARAVLLFDELDREIQRVTDNKHSLDDVVHLMIEERVVSTEELRAFVEQVMGKPSATLDTPLLAKGDNNGD